MNPSWKILYRIKFIFIYLLFTLNASHLFRRICSIWLYRLFIFVFEYIFGWTHVRSMISNNWEIVLFYWLIDYIVLTLYRQYFSHIPVMRLASFLMAPWMYVTGTLATLVLGLIVCSTLRPDILFGMILLR